MHSGKSEHFYTKAFAQLLDKYSFEPAVERWATGGISHELIGPDVWILRGIFTPQECAQLQELISLLRGVGATHRHPLSPRDTIQDPEPLVEMFQAFFEQMSKIMGRAFRYEFGFANIYDAGADLYAHKDKDMCDMTASVYVSDMTDFEKTRTLLNLRIDGKSVAATGKCGDAVLMPGNRIAHWRDPVESGTRLFSLSLHGSFLSSREY